MEYWFIKADKTKGSRTAAALKIRKICMQSSWTVEEPGLFFCDKTVFIAYYQYRITDRPSNPDDVVTTGSPIILYDAVRYEVSERKTR